MASRPEGRLVGARGWEKREWGISVSTGFYEKVLEMVGGDGCITM